jgi:hypothetical protein
MDVEVLKLIINQKAEQEYFEKRILECIKLYSQTSGGTYNGCLEYWASVILDRTLERGKYEIFN